MSCMFSAVPKLTSFFLQGLWRKQCELLPNEMLSDAFNRPSCQEGSVYVHFQLCTVYVDPNE